MALDSWLPVGHEFPDGTKAHIVVFAGVNWQIYAISDGGRALIVHDQLARSWIDDELIDPVLFSKADWGGQPLWVITCDSSQMLCPVAEATSPGSKAEALSFALALKCTRDIDNDSPMQDALYVEKISRLLPTHSISPRVNDDVVLGHWLTGGVNVSVKSFRRLRQTMTWLGASQLKDVVETAGFDVTAVVPSDAPMLLNSQRDGKMRETVDKNNSQLASERVTTVFELAGRPDLAGFINEHVVDIVLNRDRYEALGIVFPSALVLHGPPGCGKTFAVESLIEFLGWPSFEIDASSVASPYIHETSKKVAEVFNTAIDNAPSVLVIDEMEAFLADRGTNSGHHRVEEVAEFLRRIPEAVKNEVLIVAMTNRIDMIDPAILRRGRFDHVIKVDYAREIEVLSLLKKLLSTLPKEEDVDPTLLSPALAGRPLSDVSFVVREGARLSARAGNAKLNQECLLRALNSATVREREGDDRPRIGFVR